MTPGGRLAAAIEVLADIEARHRPAGDALKDWGLSHRFAGSKDRAAIGNLVYDALRWRLSSAWVMDDDSPRAAVLATFARRWSLEDALAAARSDDPHAPEPLSEAEQVRIEQADMSAAPVHVRANVPAWLAPHFTRTFGDDWVAEGETLAARPPLDLRVNRLKADREKVMKALARSAPSETQISPDGIRIAPTERDGRHPNVQVEAGFVKGWFEVQDEGSQIASLLTAVRPGEQILDLCAGGGGKTLAMAAMMGNKGQIFATDSDRARLAPIHERLKRAATRNVQVRPAGSDLTDFVGRMDAVLLDVPCTGTGVWRRRPDAKWRLSERALGERIAEQRQLLDAAAVFLKPGGRIIYVTCSLFADENGDQLNAFVDRHQDFALSPAAAIIERAELPVAAKEILGAAGIHETGVVLTPRRTGTDGFFIGVAVKT